jgi:hypothetical protein
MGRVRITRLFVLLALAALLAPRIEASRTSVSESNRPSSIASTETTSALASLAPAGVEILEPPPFNLGDVVLAESELEREDRFNLGPLDLLGPASLRGPPPSYPETRVRGFELLPPFRVGASPTLSLWSRQACGSISCGLASDSRYDPWGLSFWSSIQGYVAGVVEEADPTGLLPEVESIDAGYGSGTRDGEDFDASKTAGKWTLRGLTALKAGAQKAGKFGVQAVRNALKSQAKETATAFAAGLAGDLTERALLSAGADEDVARIGKKIAQRSAAAASTKVGSRFESGASGRGRGPDFTADLAKSKARSRSGHRNAGNKQLHEGMVQDPAIRADMERKYGEDVFDRTSTSGGGRRNPKGGEWDHNSYEPNALDLLTSEEHGEKTRREGRDGGGWKRFRRDSKE